MSSEAGCVAWCRRRRPECRILPRRLASPASKPSLARRSPAPWRAATRCVDQPACDVRDYDRLLAALNRPDAVTSLGAWRHTKLGDGFDPMACGGLLRWCIIAPVGGFASDRANGG